MKKNRRWIVALAAVMALLFAACGDEFAEYNLHGTLYTSADLLTPAVGDTLDFYEMNDDSYYIVNGVGTYYSTGKWLGWAVTDHQGRWAFSFIHGLDNPYQQPHAAKFQPAEELIIKVLIKHDGDTLYYGNASVTETLELYPGCWTAPWLGN